MQNKLIITSINPQPTFVSVPFSLTVSVYDNSGTNLLNTLNSFDILIDSLPSGNLSGALLATSAYGQANFIGISVTKEGIYSITAASTDMLSASTVQYTISSLGLSKINLSVNETTPSAYFNFQVTSSLLDQNNNTWTGLTGLTLTGNTSIFGATTGNTNNGSLNFIVYASASGSLNLTISGGLVSESYIILVLQDVLVISSVSPMPNFPNSLFTVIVLIYDNSKANLLNQNVAIPVSLSLSNLGSLSGTTSLNSSGCTCTFNSIQITTPGTFKITATSNDFINGESIDIPISPFSLSLLSVQSNTLTPSANFEFILTITLYNQASQPWTSTTTLVISSNTSIAGQTSLSTSTGLASANVFSTTPGMNLLAVSDGVKTGEVILNILQNSLKIESVVPIPTLTSSVFNLTASVRSNDLSAVESIRGVYSLTLSLSAGTLIGTTSADTSNGIAVFKDLQITVPGTCSISVASSGMNSGVSVDFNISQPSLTYIKTNIDKTSESAYVSFKVNVTLFDQSFQSWLSPTAISLKSSGILIGSVSGTAVGWICFNLSTGSIGNLSITASSTSLNDTSSIMILCDSLKIESVSPLVISRQPLTTKDLFTATICLYDSSKNHKITTAPPFNITLTLNNSGNLSGNLQNTTVQGCTTLTSLQIPTPGMFSLIPFSDLTNISDPLTLSITYPECHVSCSTCNGSSELNCTSCANGLSMSARGVCEICSEGYFFSKFSCYKCLNECLTCNESSKCLSCKNSSNIPSNLGRCSQTCGERQVSSNETCVDCSNLCSICSDPNSCEQCADNATLINSSCKCLPGHVQSSTSCIPKYFTGSIKASTLNNLKLSFTESLANDLRLSDFSISTSESLLYNYTLVQNKGEYLISMNFQSSISNNSLLVFTLLNGTILSSNSSILDKKVFTVGLFPFTYISPQTQMVISYSAMAAVATSTTSLAVGAITNPSSAWTLLNTIQIISYYPLSGKILTPNLEAFFAALGGYNILPNLMYYLFNPNCEDPPYLEAQNYGFSSSVFWINFGKNFLPLIFILLLWPVIKLVSMMDLGKITIKALEIKKHYKYCIFIRYLTQNYLDIGFISLIQLRSVKNEFGEGTFHTVSATIAIIVFLLTPFYIFISIYITYSKIQDQNEIEFREKYGSLIEEFKHNKGLLSSQYYTIYFLRRLAYVLSQVYLNDTPFIQNSFHIFFTLLALVHLLVFMPFIENDVMVSNLISEVETLVVFSTCTCFLTNLDSDIVEILEKTVMYTVIFGMVSQFLVSIWGFCKMIKQMWLRIQRYRALDLLSHYNSEMNKTVH